VIVPLARAANQTAIAARQWARSKYLADSASKSVAELAIHRIRGKRQRPPQLIRSPGLLCPLWQKFCTRNGYGLGRSLVADIVSEHAVPPRFYFR
jgi:hypothetical protein